MTALKRVGPTFAISLAIIAIAFVITFLAGSERVTPPSNSVVNGLSADGTVAVSAPSSTAAPEFERVGASVSQAAYIEVLVEVGGRLVGGAEVVAVAGRDAVFGSEVRLGSTDASGRIDLPRAALGSRGVWLSASLPGFVAQPVEVLNESRRVIVKLATLHRFDVWCVDSRGAPVDGVRVDLFQSWASVDGDTFWPEDTRHAVTTNLEGMATLSVPAGSYGCEVNHDKLAWIPDESYESFKVVGSARARFVLVEPEALSIRIREAGVERHAVHMHGGASHQRYGEKCRARTERRIRERNPGGIVSLAIPDGYKSMTAEVFVWVPDRGYGVLNCPMRPAHQVVDPAIVSLDEFDWTPVEHGAVELKLKGPGSSRGAEIGWTVMRRGGAPVATFEIRQGSSVRVPVGSYPIILPNEPVLASFVRTKLEDINVSAGESSEAVVDLPELVRVRFTCSDHTSRRLGFAYLDMHGGGVRTRVQMPGATIELLCPLGEYRMQGVTGFGDPIPSRSIVVEREGQVITLQSEPR